MTGLDLRVAGVVPGVMRPDIPSGFVLLSCGVTLPYGVEGVMRPALIEKGAEGVTRPENDGVTRSPREDVTDGGR